MCKNLLSINANKSQFMLIGPDSMKREFELNNVSICIGQDRIKQVKRIKYLGVLVDDKLTFKDHANCVISKLSFSINFLSRCSSYLSFWSKLMIYNALVLPHFNYCTTILYTLNQNEIARMQKLQNRAMRIILCCSRYTPIRQMHHCLNWLPVLEYFNYKVLVFIFKLKIGSAPSYLLNKLTYVNEIHSHNTRQRNNFFIAPRNSKLCRNSLFYSGLDAFNKLPSHIKSISSLSTFKWKLKAYLLTKCEIVI